MLVVIDTYRKSINRGNAAIGRPKRGVDFCWNPACAVLLVCATIIPLRAQTLTTLAGFNGPNGARPGSSLVQGTDGNFYGNTGSRGANNGGTIFKITPSGAFTTFYNFCSLPGCADGTGGGGLVQGSNGNFYGTTAGGGSNAGGTVFSVTPSGTLRTLYSFCSLPNCADGNSPNGGLIQASDGNFYGTTRYDFPPSNPAAPFVVHGTVFRITPGGKLTTLHTFCSLPGCADGQQPVAGLIQASDGNFYGTTEQGGANSFGTIFKITVTGTLTTLYSFCSLPGCADGQQPVAALIEALDGNFYGTTGSGGTTVDYGPGTVFKLSPGGTLTTLYVFCSLPGCADGEQPVAGLIQGSDGNFYGTTQIGGADNEGTVFKVTPGGALTTIYSFCSLPGCADGEDPLAGLIQGTDGSFYGTTLDGGTNNLGTAFRLALTSSTTSPVIDPDGIVSSASFQGGIAPGSWITIFGTNLSAVPHTWADAIVDGNLPTSLYGVKVNVGSEPGYISYISPTQINVVAPSNLGTGTLPVTVTTPNGTSTAVTASVQPVQPAFFQWGNYAVATTQDYSPAIKNGTLPGVISAPAKPGDVIILWGTGFGPTSPSAPSGVEVPSDMIYYTANPVAVTVGGIAATVYGAALAPGYAGLYQVAIQIPRSLANGDYPVVATVLGAESPSITLITVQD